MLYRRARSVKLVSVGVANRCVVVARAGSQLYVGHELEYFSTITTNTPLRTPSDAHTHVSLLCVCSTVLLNDDGGVSAASGTERWLSSTRQILALDLDSGGLGGVALELHDRDQARTPNDLDTGVIHLDVPDKLDVFVDAAAQYDVSGSLEGPRL